MTHEIPSPIDFSDMAQARAWVADTIARRPSRPLFFNAFCSMLTLHFDGPIRIAELGSGPGHLARAILLNCLVQNYTAIDFSPAMHEIAREHLGEMAPRVCFFVADFREPDWQQQIRGVDALVTMQAAHEVRHKSHLPLLLSRAYEVIRPKGLFLYCDHYVEAGAGKNADLHVTREEQPQFLATAGFNPVSLIHEESGMALYAAVRP